jgi:undecaprenyl-diphosphatase
VNRQLLRTINGWAGHNWLLDHIMIFCASWLIYLVFAVAAGCAVALARRRQWRPLGDFAAVLVVSYGLLKVASHVYVDERPFMTQRVHQLVAHAGGTSFPSDHTTAAAAIGLGLLLLTRFQILGALTLGAAVLIGFARIFVGIHWPIDIAGGLLTGFIGAALVWGGERLVTRAQQTTMRNAA